MALSAGVVTLTLEYGKGLKDQDWFGRMDPYAILKCGGSTMRSKTHTDGGRNPVWNQSFNFNVINENTIEIELWDKDVMSRDDHIGSCTASLAKVRASGIDHQQLHVVSPRSRKQHGFISVALKFVPNQQPMQHGYSAPSPYGAPAPYQPQHSFHPPAYQHQPSFHPPPQPAHSYASQPSFHPPTQAAYPYAPQPSFHQAPQPSFHQAPQPSFHQAPQPSFHQPSQSAYPPPQPAGQPQYPSATPAAPSAPSYYPSPPTNQQFYPGGAPPPSHLGAPPPPIIFH